MGMRVTKTDGSVSIVSSAVRQEWTGAGLRLFDASGAEVAFYRDGTYTGCEPSDTVIEQPAVPEQAP